MKERESNKYFKWAYLDRHCAKNFAFYSSINKQNVELCFFSNLQMRKLAEKNKSNSQVSISWKLQDWNSSPGLTIKTFLVYFQQIVSQIQIFCLNVLSLLEEMKSKGNIHFSSWLSLLPTLSDKFYLNWALLTEALKVITFYLIRFYVKGKLICDLQVAPPKGSLT